MFISPGCVKSWKKIRGTRILSKRSTASDINLSDDKKITRNVPGGTNGLSITRYDGSTIQNVTVLEQLAVNELITKFGVSNFGLTPFNLLRTVHDLLKPYSILTHCDVVEKRIGKPAFGQHGGELVEFVVFVRVAP